MGKRARPRPAPAAAARGRRKILRKRAGSLHGRVIQPGTAQRYPAHVKDSTLATDDSKTCVAMLAEKQPRGARHVKLPME